MIEVAGVRAFRPADGVRTLLAALASDLRPAPEMIPLTADDLGAALKPWTPEPAAREESTA